MSTPAFLRWLSLGLLVACVGTLIAGCSVPSRPLWWPKPKESSSLSSPAANRRHNPSTDKVLVVAKVWHSGLPQLGIDVYWVNNPDDSDQVVQAKARRIINYAISLNANSISVSFPIYTYGLDSDTLFASKKTTPSPARIAIFLSEAAKSHIRVTLRPLLSETALIAQDSQAWRGVIEPVDRSAWFESYTRLLLPYAAVAASGHAATFVIGTELDSLEGDPRWPALIQAVKSEYGGELLYDENYNEFQDHHTDLPLSTFGVDAYPRFQLDDNATVGELTEAWEAWLGTHTLVIRKKAILGEVGIAAVAGAYRDPGDWLETTRSRVIPHIQENWYKAACRAMSAENIGGVYWWEVSFDADPTSPGPFQADRITFLGRAAQQEVKSCFTQLGDHVP
jgi:hypothetical protein